MADAIPSKWVTIVVEYGEKQKHLYAETVDYPVCFWDTEDQAQKAAEDHCRFNQRAMVLVLRADRMVKARPVEFDSIKAV